MTYLNATNPNLEGKKRYSLEIQEPRSRSPKNGFLEVNYSELREILEAKNPESI